MTDWKKSPYLLIVVWTYLVHFLSKKRKTLKRYGALFMCLASCAIHIEMIKNMGTDSFILALRRFIGWWTWQYKNNPMWQRKQFCGSRERQTDRQTDRQGYVRTVQLYLGCSDQTKLINRVLVCLIDLSQYWRKISFLLIQLHYMHS